MVFAHYTLTMGWPPAWLFAFVKGEMRMLKRVMLKRQMLIGLCILLAGLLMVPVVVVAGDKVNINTADKESLSTLSGIGPVTAERIIEYREKVEPFKSIEELTKVKGIGEKTFLKIKDSIVVK